MKRRPLFIGFLLLLLPCLAETEHFPLQFDEADLDRSADSPIQSYSNTLRDVTPSVVAVTTKQVVRRYYPNAPNPLENLLRKYYGLPQKKHSQPFVEEEKVPTGFGSGVIVSPQGHIVTNAHVITDPLTGKSAEEVLVRMGEGTEFPARVIGFDHSTDIAVLKIEAKEELPFATMANSDLLQVGDVVFAVGNPLGIGMTVTMGIVSATRRSELGILREDGAYENFIQTDASINQGNSGGALLDAKGRLIGINTAIISQTGANIGIGLAIPSNMVRRALVDYLEEGRIRRGFLGVFLELDEDSQAVVVKSVAGGSAADLAGLLEDDRILMVGEETISSVNQARVAISQSLPGTELPILVLRNGEEKTLSVVLGAVSDGITPIPGIKLRELDSVTRKRFGIPELVRGVVVFESTGQSETFKQGVVIAEINGIQIQTKTDVSKSLNSGINRFYVWYRGKYRFIAYRIP